MKQCDRIAEIHEDCRRLANVETGEKETPLGEKETPLGEKVTKVGEKANCVGEKKIIGLAPNARLVHFEILRGDHLVLLLLVHI